MSRLLTPWPALMQFELLLSSRASLWLCLKSSKSTTHSAEGAKYESQGQARSEAERVAPGNRIKVTQALKGRNTLSITALQAWAAGAS
jgi:hypothetical protein